MDLTSVNTIKELLLKHSAKPSKIMGQNFLIDRVILKKTIEAAQLTQEDNILEVGPGIGTLTKELAQKAKKVIAIEKDRTMIEILKEILKDYKNIEVIQSNALNYPDFSIQKNRGSSIQPQLNRDKLPTHYKIVANIPYYLTSPLIRKFLEEKYQPEVMVLMVQKEVAQRICSTPPHMSLLAVSVQFYAKAEIVSYVSKKCFWPSPKVDSAIIKIIPKTNLEKVDKDLFFKIAKAGFSQKRKQLINNLSRFFEKDKNQTHQWILKNNINPTQRAETLSLQDWINLTNNQ
jgi:16S rRNA (adenine1518-N6/adenine1519-N6)-dimethyltransferase